MPSNPIFHNIHRLLRLNFAVIATALLMSITAFGSADSRSASIDSTTQLFGLNSSIAPIFSHTSTELQCTVSSEAPQAFAGVSVSLPMVNATPGLISVPITVADITNLNVISYDLNIDFNSAVVVPASPAFIQTGTLSSTMSITPNAANPGHLMMSALQGGSISGAGTMISVS